MKNIIIASTSTVHGSDYLEYLLPELKSTLDIATRYYLFHTQDLAVFHMKNIQQSASAFKINIAVKGIHEFDDAVSAVESRRNFTGGGNTLYWLLSYTKQHHECSCSKKKGTPYLGTSAGSVIWAKHANH
jgi:dipeptidase E